MIPEHYLEYLALNSVLNDCMCFREPIKDATEYHKIWFADNSSTEIDAIKLKKRVTELQKDFLKDYLCTDKTRKSN